MLHAAHPQMSSYDPLMPWNSIFKAAAVNTEFWDRELKEPAMLYAVGRGRTNPSFVSQQHDSSTLQPPPSGDGGSRKRKRDRGRGRGNGSQAQQQQLQQQSQRRQDGGQPKGQGKAAKGQGKASGRHTRDRDGKQLCFTWNRTAGGCTTGQCPNGRFHMCEICLQPHRMIDHGGGEGGAQQGGNRHV